jgi:hypothetical protein
VKISFLCSSAPIATYARTTLAMTVGPILMRVLDLRKSDADDVCCSSQETPRLLAARQLPKKHILSAQAKIGVSLIFLHCCLLLITIVIITTTSLSGVAQRACDKERRGKEKTWRVDVV